MSTFDSNKVRADIADLKNKRSTLLLSIQNDIDNIAAKKHDDFAAIGERAYTLARIEGSDSLATLDLAFANIDNLNTQLAAKEQKKLEISARYDEEIEILEKLIPPEPVQPAAATAQAFCPSCGKLYRPGEDFFCMGCGTKLT
ncbi:MAG: hypothetical protein FWG68_07915 [Defluviitaleaceae bacterium]|nr:hypothetical protein [Defluviitaleaceae bacterium]